MCMSKLAVVGPRDSVLAFRALGADTFAVTDKQSALDALEKTRAEGYQIVFITEALTEELAPELKAMAEHPTPVVIMIPDNRGSLGIGMERMRKSVERAIGVDILFKGEK